MGATHRPAELSGEILVAFCRQLDQRLGHNQPPPSLQAGPRFRKNPSYRNFAMTRMTAIMRQSTTFPDQLGFEHGSWCWPARSATGIPQRRVFERLLRYAVRDFPDLRSKCANVRFRDMFKTVILGTAAIVGFEHKVTLKLVVAFDTNDKLFPVFTEGAI